MKYWLLTALCFTIGIDAASAQSTKTISTMSPGCRSQEVFTKLVGFQVDHDQEAFKKLLMAGLLSGECTVFKVGDAVYLEDVKIFSGLTCLRPKGEISCFWTFLESTK